MAQPILFPDVAAEVGAWLREQLNVDTDTRVPNPRPDEWLMVRRVGGPRRDLVIDDATLAIEAWSVSDANSHDLAQLARAYLIAMVGETVGDSLFVYRVDELSGVANLPDPESTQSRHTFTVAVTVRGVVLSGS